MPRRGTMQVEHGFTLGMLKDLGLARLHKIVEKAKSVLRLLE